MQTIQMLLRIVVLAMLAALIGAALRSLVKRTAVELLSSRTLTGLQPFLTTTNVRRWIHSAAALLALAAVVTSAARDRLSAQEPQNPREASWQPHPTVTVSSPT